MAKSRKTARKTARKTGRKPGARKTTPRKRASAARKVELRPVRRQLEAHKKSLQGAEQTQKVKSALKRLDRCLREIQAICGPNMSIPLG